MTEQNKSIERKGHPKECEGRFHDGQNGTWKCWECGTIGGGFNDVPQQQNKSIEDFKNNYPSGLWVECGIDKLEYVDVWDKVISEVTSLVQQSKEEERERIVEELRKYRRESNSRCVDFDDQIHLINGSVEDCRWNLKDDDLEKQSEETIKFLHKLLEAKENADTICRICGDDVAPDTPNLTCKNCLEKTLPMILLKNI